MIVQRITYYYWHMYILFCWVRDPLSEVGRPKKKLLFFGFNMKELTRKAWIFTSFWPCPLKHPRKCIECKRCSAALTGSASAQQKQQSRSLWATALNKTEKAWNPQAGKRNKALIACPNPYTKAEPCPTIWRKNFTKNRIALVLKFII